MKICLDAEHYGKYNGTIDWSAVKKSGNVDFCIIRAGYDK